MSLLPQGIFSNEMSRGSLVIFSGNFLVLISQFKQKYLGGTQIWNLLFYGCLKVIYEI